MSEPTHAIYYLRRVIPVLLPGSHDARRSLADEGLVVGVGSAMLVICIVSAVVVAIILHMRYNARLQNQLNQLLGREDISPLIKALLKAWRPALLMDSHGESMLSFLQQLELDMTPLFAANALDNESFCNEVAETVMQHMMAQKRRYRIKTVACKWRSQPQRMEFYRVVFAVLQMPQVCITDGYWFSDRDINSTGLESAEPTDEARHCARIQVALNHGADHANATRVSTQCSKSSKINALYTKAWSRLRLDHPIAARVLAMASLLSNDETLNKAMLATYLAGAGVRLRLNRYANSAEDCDFAIDSVLMVLIHFGLAPVNSMRLDNLCLYQPFLTGIVEPDVRANAVELDYFIAELKSSFNQTVNIAAESDTVMEASLGTKEGKAVWSSYV